MEPARVTPRLFRALQTVDVKTLSECSDTELRPVLAALVRMSLIASLDKGEACSEGRTTILKILSRIELVNSFVALLSIDFHALENDVRKEMALRAKVGNSASDSALINGLNVGPELEFERSSANSKLRLVLSELLALMSSGPNSDGSLKMKPSELFDHLVYLSEVCDVLAIATAELPNLLNPPEVCEGLLRVKHGPYIICHVVANQPDCLAEVVGHLLRNGEHQDGDSLHRNRQLALLLLCDLDPYQILPLRSKCVELCRLPSLALSLTLKNSNNASDLVAFISGLLLGADQQVRAWFSLFIREGNNKRNEALTSCRATLLIRLSEQTTAMRQPSVPNHTVISATAILRLYTALRGIAGLKFTEEEIICLVDIITSHPPVSAAGAKFLSLGLCMLIACNSLTTTSQTLERRVVDWLRWLVEEEASYERNVSSGRGSFSEMLLLMAIHFHANQTTAICDLVCQTLGMKIAIRSSSMSKIRYIFTNEVFTDQVVASHAVRVPVTKHLSANVPGFLPVHCIHQLLKSRAFSKHKVPIKDWILRQISECKTPLHPVMPALIEVYVNSILIPATPRSGGQAQYGEQTNEPFSEQEIKAFFRKPVFTSTQRKRTSRESTPMKLWSTPTSSRAASPLLASYSCLDNDVEDIPDMNVTTQVLVLYYVLLYEAVRLNHMRNIIAANRRVVRYSNDLFATLPIKFLLQTAEKEQEMFSGVFPQLLRHCTTQFPQLCMVQDWLSGDELRDALPSTLLMGNESIVLEAHVKDALTNLRKCPSKLVLLIKKLVKMPPQDSWQFADLIFSNLRAILDPLTPLQLQELYRDFWVGANSVYPRKLWAMTVNHLNHVNGEVAVRKKITQDDLILDPLQALRCDRRVFTCAPILEIVLYIVKGSLAASRTHLANHIQDNPIVERAQTAQVSNDIEREELKNALIATQESAAIQIILEAGLLSIRDESKGRSNVKEMKLICTFLHEAFIADPNLAKLVHFQGYPLELLPITVAGVPSMHICLGFAPELLSQPDLEKQVFAIDLVSHLSVQYALPKSYSVARLAVNALSTLLSVLNSDERLMLFAPTLPSLVRFCKAFPPLIEDVIGLLLQYGRICVSESCLSNVTSPRNFDMSTNDGGNLMEEVDELLKKMGPEKNQLAVQIRKTFCAILENSVLERRIY